MSIPETHSTDRAVATGAFGAPVVATYGEADPSAPLVVLLHGRGSSERDILSLAPHLPDCLAYAAVRAPIAEGGGFAWFANRGIGRPVAESLDATMRWFTRWLDEVAPPGRPVFLVGFSGGAAFAGGLVLADPSRYAGAAILYGTLPFDAGIPVDAGRLANLPMFLARGDVDRVIPRELLDRTWTYLLAESGAPTVARRDQSGHGITGATLHRLSGWIADRAGFLSHHEPARIGVPTDVVWPSLPDGLLRHRTGQRPQVSWSIPQQQQSQNAPAGLKQQLFERISGLTGVSTGESHISVPGARAFLVAAGAVPRMRSSSHRSGSSLTFTPAMTAPFTLLCQHRWLRTSSPEAGANPTHGPGPGSHRDSSCSSGHVTATSSRPSRPS